MKKPILYLSLGAFLAAFLILRASRLHKGETSETPESSPSVQGTPPPPSRHAWKRLEGDAAGDPRTGASGKADPLRDWRSRIRREAARTSYYANRWAWSEALLPLVDLASGWPEDRLRAELKAVEEISNPEERRLAREVLILTLGRNFPVEALELADGSVSPGDDVRGRNYFLLQETFEAAAARNGSQALEWLEESGRIGNRAHSMPLIEGLARQTIREDGDFATAGRLAALARYDTSVARELAGLAVSRQVDPRTLESCLGSLGKGHQSRYFSFILGSEVAAGKVPDGYARQLLSSLPGEAQRDVIESYFDKGMNGGEFTSDIND